MEFKNGGKLPPRIRIMTVGSVKTGKSCLIKRYCEKRFVSKYFPTIGVDYGSTIVDIDGRKISVHFFDTSGSSLFKQVRIEFYKDMQGILLVYDVTNKNSFLDLENWTDELHQNLGPENERQIIVVVCGTSIDTGVSSARQVSEIEGRNWAESRGFPHITASSAVGNGVSKTFYNLFNEALKLKEGTRPSASFSVSPEVVQTIYRLTHSKEDFEKLNLSKKNISEDEINKAYRRLAGIVHPDKCNAVGAEEAFKSLTQARTNLLNLIAKARLPPD